MNRKDLKLQQVIGKGEFGGKSISTSTSVISVWCKWSSPMRQNLIYIKDGK